MPWKRMLAYVTGEIEESLLQRVEYLIEENRVLRNQISKRSEAPVPLQFQQFTDEVPVATQHGMLPVPVETPPQSPVSTPDDFLDSTATSSSPRVAQYGFHRGYYSRLFTISSTSWATAVFSSAGESTRTHGPQDKTQRWTSNRPVAEKISSMSPPRSRFSCCPGTH